MLGSVTELLSGNKPSGTEDSGPVKQRESAQMTLEDLNHIKVLGHGAFGCVKCRLFLGSVCDSQICPCCM